MREGLEQAKQCQNFPFTNEELNHSSGHDSWTQFIENFTFASLNSDHGPLLEEEEKAFCRQKDAKVVFMGRST